VDTDAQASQSSPLGLLAGLGALSGEGPVAEPDLSLDVAADFGPVTAQANLTRVDGTLYAGLLGRNFEIQADEELTNLDIGGTPRALLGWVEDPRETERTTVDGVTTVRISAQINRDAAIEDLAPLLDDGGLSAAQQEELKDALTRGELEIWIGESDLLPRRIQVGITLDGEVRDVAFGRLDLDGTLNLSAYGEPVEITAPPDAEPLPLDDIAALLGG
jgi:hypothetical protein